MRMFFAIDLPDEIKKKIMEVKDELEKIVKAKWVEFDNLHITIKFLGEVNNNTVNYLIEEINRIKFKQFDAEIKGLGGFPNIKYPRVLWVGVNGDFLSIFNPIENICTKYGLKKEERAFKPHITLGRVKFISSRNRYEKLVRKLANIKIGNIRIKELKLKESILRWDGPIYKDFKIWKFKE